MQVFAATTRKAGQRANMPRKRSAVKFERLIIVILGSITRYWLIDIMLCSALPLLHIAEVGNNVPQQTGHGGKAFADSFGRCPVLLILKRKSYQIIR